jgi:hypothetical protein
MSDSNTAIRIENILLEKCRTHANELKRLHCALYSVFNGRVDMALLTTVAL